MSAPVCTVCNGTGSRLMASGWPTHETCTTCHGEGVLRCLDRDNPNMLGCSGPIEVREALSPTGIPYPRCKGHWQDRLREQERISRTYPEHPPADFDPLYAGESWYED